MTLHAYLLAAALAWTHAPASELPFLEQLVDDVAWASDYRADISIRLLSQAFWESRLLSRIGRDECRKWECDGGLAHGVWQLHASGLTQRQQAELAATYVRTMASAFTTYRQARMHAERWLAQHPPPHAL